MPLVTVEATRSKTWWVGIVTLVASAVTFWVAQGYGTAGLMPGVASAAIFLMSLVHTVVGLVSGVIANNDDWYSDAETTANAPDLRLYMLVGLMVGMSVWLVGFHLTLPVFLFTFIVFKTRNWIAAASMAVLIFVFTYVILNGVLNIILPTSILRKFLIANGWS